MRTLLVFALAGTIACSGAVPFSSDAGQDTVVGLDASPPGDLVSILESGGFTVKKGSFEFLDLSACCQTTCSGNNPTSPYGAFYVPEGPGQTAPNANARMDGTSAAYRLRADEAIVYVGPTAPAAAYYGFTPYLMDRATDQGKRAPIFASLSETLNSRVIAAFESRTAIIASGDSKTTQSMRDALTLSGFPANAINVVVFDPAIARFGLDANADTFGVLFRLALVEDAAKKDAFLKNPGAAVYRVTPSARAVAAPLPSPAPRAKSADGAELTLATAVKRLSDAIVSAHASFTSQAVFVDDGVPNPNACIAQMKFCAGDNRDTTYPGTLPRILFPTDDDFYVVFGVDHHVSGKTVYSNFSVYALEHLVGLTSIASDKYAGSAQTYLPNDQDAPKLYAWKIARTCKGEPFCLEVPKGSCPTGIENGALGTITFRTYLEPATNTAPDAGTLVRDRVLHFKK
jgi:hypothetical protein